MEKKKASGSSLESAEDLFTKSVTVTIMYTLAGIFVFLAIVMFSGVFSNNRKMKRFEKRIARETQMTGVKIEEIYRYIGKPESRQDTCDFIFAETIEAGISEKTIMKRYANVYIEGIGKDKVKIYIAKYEPESGQFISENIGDDTSLEFISEEIIRQKQKSTMKNTHGLFLIYAKDSSATSIFDYRCF